MSDPVAFGRSKLATYLTCPRRFELRYVRRIPWPLSPMSEKAEEALARGQAFHQLIERHFSGVPVDAEEIADSSLRRWWKLFRKSALADSSGRLLPEVGLTLSIGRHQLTGRFDLLVIGESDGKSFAHIFDWKTGKSLTEPDLRRDWQTRLYLAIMMEGSAAVLPEGQLLEAEGIFITYWYVTDPEVPRTIHYDRPWHQQNWAEIQALIDQIDQSLENDEWPLTDDWSQCRPCAYQAICGRLEAGVASQDMSGDEEPEEAIDLQLEPDLP